MGTRAGDHLSALASGLLGILCVILHPIHGPDFRTFMGTFLRLAGESPGRLYNLSWSFALFVLPVVAMSFLWDARGSAPFVLTASGWIVVGVIVVSHVVKTPHYRVMLAWDPAAMSPDWGAGRHKYFLINWTQLVTTWTAFALFIGALAAFERAGPRIAASRAGVARLPRACPPPPCG